MDYETIPHAQNNVAEITAFYNQNEALADPTLRRDYFAQMTPDDFLTVLQQVNSVIRTGDSTALQPFDGDGVALGMHQIPNQVDKPDLLRETWETARKFLDDPKLSDEDALTYAGLVSAGGLLLAHPFIDSNGRTSRVWSHMLIHGSDERETDDLEKLLGENGNQEWAVMPMPNTTLLYANYPYDKSSDVPAVINWSDDGNFLDHEEIRNTSDPGDKLIDSRFSTRALNMFMLHADEHAREVVWQYVNHDEAGNPISLDADQALAALTHDPNKGIGYAAQLSEAESWTRSDYVRRYLRSMEQEVARTPVKQFDKRVKSLGEHPEATPMQVAQLKAFGRYAVNGTQLTPRDHSRILLDSSPIQIERAKH